MGTRFVFCAILFLLTCPAWAACTLSDIRVLSVDATFEKGSRFQAQGMKGRATLVNGCAEPVEVMLRLVAYDKAGKPVASIDRWAAGVGMLPGEQKIALDKWLDYSGEIARFGLTPVNIRLPWAGCVLSDIRIKSVDVQFVRGRSNSELQGSATLVNACASPIGVRVQLAAYDKAGKLVSSRDGWAAGLRNNLKPGEHTFSLNNWLGYSAEVARFELKPVEIRNWH